MSEERCFQSAQDASPPEEIALLGVAWLAPAQQLAPFAMPPGMEPSAAGALRDAGFSADDPALRIARFSLTTPAGNKSPTEAALAGALSCADAVLAAVAALRDRVCDVAIVCAEALELQPRETVAAWLVFARGFCERAYAVVSSAACVDSAASVDSSIGWRELPETQGETVSALKLVRAALVLRHKVLPGGRPFIHPLPLPGRTPLGPPRRAVWLSARSDGRLACLHLQEHTRAALVDGIPFDHELCLFAAESVSALRTQLLGCIEGVSARLLSDAEPAQLRLALASLSFQLAQHLHRAGRYRIAVVAESLSALLLQLRAAADALAGAEPDCLSRVHRPSAGIYAGTSVPDGESGQTAFVFPGLGAAYPSMLRELCWHFPAVREVFDSIDYVVAAQGESLLPSQEIFAQDGAPAELLASKAAVITLLLAEWALAELLRELGVIPDCLMGCSTGEFAALCQSGAINAVEAVQVFYQLSLGVAQRMPSALLHKLRTVIATAPAEEVAALLSADPGAIHISADLGADSILLVGEQEAATRLCSALSARGHGAHLLPRALPYHTPFLDASAVGGESELQSLVLRAPGSSVWSCATTRPYPVEPQAMLADALRLFSLPIALRETVEKMYAAGVRTFIEVGPSDGISRRVSAILRGREHTVLASNVGHRSSLAQLLQLLAALHVRGKSLELAPLFRRRPYVASTVGPIVSGRARALPSPQQAAQRLRSQREVGTALPAVTIGLPHPELWQCVRVRRSELPKELRESLSLSALCELAARRAAQRVLSVVLRTSKIDLSEIELVATEQQGLRLRGAWTATIGGELSAATASCACGESAVALVAAPGIDARLGIAAGCVHALAELPALQLEGAAAAIQQVYKDVPPLEVAAHDPWSGWTALRRTDDATLFHARGLQLDGHLITTAVFPSLRRVA